MSALKCDSAPPRKALLAAVLFMAALAMPGAGAEESEAPVKKPRTLQPEALEIPEGRYLFRFKWNGIPSARSEIAVRLESDGGAPHYLFEGSAQTSVIVNIFWRFRASVAALVESVDGRAKRINTTEQENNRFKETETIFDYELGEAYYTRWKKGRIKRRTIDLGSGIIDLASFGMMMCRRPLEVGDSDSFTVLFKDDAYLLEYEVISRGRISVAGKEYDALRIEPKFRKIKQEKKPPKIRQMTLWISESAPHLPLRLRSRTFIGHVTGELAAITPLDAGNENETDLSPREEPEAIPSA